MRTPKVRDETSVNEREGSRQAVKDNEAAGLRIREALGDREVSWLSRETGYGDSTLRDALRRGPVRSDVALAIAKALSVSIDWLLTGERGNAVVAVEEADFVDVPEYSLFEIDEQGKLWPLMTTKIRKDWLYSSLGETSGLWIAAAPSRYEALGIEPMTMIFCKDHSPAERLIHGVHYVFRINGGVILARFALREDASDEPTVLPRDIGHDDDQHIPVARIVGLFARPI
jgi:hypothetical protein